jgi:hypothetical protein
MKHKLFMMAFVAIFFGLFTLSCEKEMEQLPDEVTQNEVIIDEVDLNALKSQSGNWSGVLCVFSGSNSPVWGGSGGSYDASLSAVGFGPGSAKNTSAYYGDGITQNIWLNFTEVMPESWTFAWYYRTNKSLTHALRIVFKIDGSGTTHVVNSDDYWSGGPYWSYRSTDMAGSIESYLDSHSLDFKDIEWMYAQFIAVGSISVGDAGWLDGCSYTYTEPADQSPQCTVSGPSSANVSYPNLNAYTATFFAGCSGYYAYKWEIYTGSGTIVGSSTSSLVVVDFDGYGGNWVTLKVKENSDQTWSEKTFKAHTVYPVF